MNRHFRWGQREDQPSVASVHGWEPKDLPQEGAISFRVLAGDDYVSAKYHTWLLSLHPDFKLPQQAECVMQLLLSRKAKYLSIDI
jgi:hypothetical protein